MLDRPVTMEPGTSYGLRIRLADNTHAVRLIESHAGQYDTVRLTGPGPLPAFGDLVVFGVAGEEATEAIIKAVESQRDMTARLTMVRHAPQIEELVDGSTIPNWLPLVPEERPSSVLQPEPPEITVTSGSPALAPDTETPPVVVTARPGVNNRPPLGTFAITCSGTTHVVAAASGRAEFTGFGIGDAITVTATATSLFGLTSSPCAAVAHVVAARDDLPPDVVSLTAGRSGSNCEFNWPAVGNIDVVGYRLRVRPGSTLYGWSDLGSLHDGLVTASPYQSLRPRSEGTHTVGIVAVDNAGQQSAAPLTVLVTLAPSAIPLTHQRIETAAGWPGVATGGSTATGKLVGGAAPSTVSYVTTTIDLGSDKAVSVSADTYGLAGSGTLSMQVGTTAQGAPTGAFIPLGPVTCRYLKISVSVSNLTGVAGLADLVTLIA